VITDLPFKIHEKTIVIIKNIPVFQCDGCIEYLLDDSVMQRVEQIMATVDTAAELEVVRFAA
jgi:YgiT-type zinc finger domain-containing protein